MYISRNNAQTFLNIQSPKYLGPAYTDGAVYVASLQDQCTDIVVFKGNLSSTTAADSTGMYHVYMYYLTYAS